LKAEDELISKFKIKIGKKLLQMFGGIAENMLENNKQVIINLLKDNKDLVQEVISK
jgi:hypothetical protein